MVWNTSTGERRHSVEHDWVPDWAQRTDKRWHNEVLAGMFSADGGLLLTLTRHEICIWSAQTGDRLESLTLPRSIHFNHALFLPAWAP